MEERVDEEPCDERRDEMEPEDEEEPRSEKRPGGGLAPSDGLLGGAHRIQYLGAGRRRGFRRASRAIPAAKPPT